LAASWPAGPVRDPLGLSCCRFYLAQPSRRGGTPWPLRPVIPGMGWGWGAVLPAALGWSGPLRVSPGSHHPRSLLAAAAAAVPISAVQDARIADTRRTWC